ncbi:MAG: hypothetical protein QXE43_00615 [Candidatus Aenigmatarchaeota archaeon]|nr:hypothetical protein [Candidatus Aenigmarchaeota archaeon]
MSDPITELILTLQNLGFFKFIIPFILTSAVFYGLLRKSKIFGDPKENIAINATIAISAAFLVSAAPIIAGIDITSYLSGFLIYITFVTVAIIAISFIPFIFKPSIEELGATINKKTFLIMFFITLIIFIIIGLLIFRNLNFILPQIASEEFYATLGLIIFLVIFSIVIYFSLRPTKTS